MTDSQKKATRELAQFLSHHESDIALDINDYGDLFGIFVEIFSRRPIDIKGTK